MLFSQKNNRSKTQKMSSTINTKDNRKIVYVEYSAPASSFKIPDGLDLEDRKVVDQWWVRWNTLYIEYVDKEKEVEQIQPVDDYEDDRKRPVNAEIVDADDMGIEYSEDEEEENE